MAIQFSPERYFHGIWCAPNFGSIIKWWRFPLSNMEKTIYLKILYYKYIQVVCTPNGLGKPQTWDAFFLVIMCSPETKQKIKIKCSHEHTIDFQLWSIQTWNSILWLSLECAQAFKSGWMEWKHVSAFMNASVLKKKNEYREKECRSMDHLQFASFHKYSDRL